MQPATITQSDPMMLTLSGTWTAYGLNDAIINRQFRPLLAGVTVIADGSGVGELDSAGAWVLQGLLVQLRKDGGMVTLKGLKPSFLKLLNVVALHLEEVKRLPTSPLLLRASILEAVGRRVSDSTLKLIGALRFIGETSIVVVLGANHPSRIRWRPILFNICTAGVDALPIVGLLSLLLGVVVAYQAADQLRQYGPTCMLPIWLGFRYCENSPL